MMNRIPRKLEKCQIPQDILCLTKRRDRSNTVCIARERLKVRCKRDKVDGASEDSEEVQYSTQTKRTAVRSPFGRYEEIFK